MTQTSSPRLDPATAEAVLAVAVRAPSIHNTQPWRFVLDDDGLLVLADRSRQLAVADPDGHSMLVSCGAALHLTQVALRAAGWDVETTLFPVATDPDVLARLRPLGLGEPDEDAVAAADCALQRRSDRRPFRMEKVTSEDIETLRQAGSDAVAQVDFPMGVDQRVDLAVAVTWADRVERDDQAYVAEMRRWINDPEVHAVVDGVPLDAVPHVPADAQRRTDVPLRDFEVGMPGRQMIELDVDEPALIGVVLTDADGPHDHLWAGHAMMRLMVRAQALGLATCPLSQAVDFAAFRTRVQGLMGWVGYPQIMLRVGHPTSPVVELPRTPRREPANVLEVSVSA